MLNAEVIELIDENEKAARKTIKVEMLTEIMNTSMKAIELMQIQKRKRDENGELEDYEVFDKRRKIGEKVLEACDILINESNTIINIINNIELKYS